MRILIADDDRFLCRMLQRYVLACGHQVVETVSAGGLSVIQSYGRHLADLVLLDIRMPRLNGLTVCHTILSRHPDAKIVLMSGVMDRHDYSVAHSGAAAYLQKPFELEELGALLMSLAPEEAAPECAMPAAA
jgi:CheY-like chemotaxis protein